MVIPPNATYPEIPADIKTTIAASGQKMCKTDNSQYIEINPNDKIVCVNISSTYDKNEREDDYDRARHYWKVSLNKAEKANLVLATVHGIVKAVFKPHRWYLTDSTKYPGTYEFEGEQIFDSPYLGKCVWNMVNKFTVTFSYINI